MSSLCKILPEVRLQEARGNMERNGGRLSASEHHYFGTTARSSRLLRIIVPLQNKKRKLGYNLKFITVVVSNTLFLETCSHLMWKT